MKHLKKLLVIMVAMSFAFGLLTACSSATNSETKSNEEASESFSDVSINEEDLVNEETDVAQHYYFRNSKLLNQHYKKHGEDMGYSSPEEYEEAACQVINNPDALHKTEKEDGDDVYYLEETNEFVILSSDGYIRTYFLPDAGLDYYNRQ